jgi:small GTP-binding protein
MTTVLDFVPKSFQLSDGSVVNCLIYDTAGQERYNSINESYYQKADAVLLVYDISNRKSFEQIKNYYCPKIEENCKKNIPIILLGNKADKENQRVVSIEEGAALAVEHKFKFKETSCLKNENVADAFEALIEIWNVEYHKKKLIQTMRNEELPRSRTRAYTSCKLDKENDNIIARHNSTIDLEDKIEESNQKDGTFKIEGHKHKKDKDKKKKCHC